MLLLHHNPDGASGRTRTDDCEFTKLALLLLRHRGENWYSHVDLHHELPPSQSGVQSYLHLESVFSAEFGVQWGMTATPHSSPHLIGVRDQTCTG